MEKEAANALIKALKEARCNEADLVEDGVVGKETIKSLDDFCKSWSTKTTEQTNAVILAVKNLLEAKGEKELSTPIKADGEVGPVVIAGLRRIFELYDHEYDGVDQVA